jgi:hypothetical protein
VQDKCPCNVSHNPKLTLETSKPAPAVVLVLDRIALPENIGKIPTQLPVNEQKSVIAIHKYIRNHQHKQRTFMHEPEILDKNLVVRIPISFNQYLAEVAKHNNLRPATFSRLILMRHAQEYHKNNRLF